MTQTVEFMFSNVAYRATVYKTGLFAQLSLKLGPLHFGAFWYLVCSETFGTNFDLLALQDYQKLVVLVVMNFQAEFWMCSFCLLSVRTHSTIVFFINLPFRILFGFVLWQNILRIGVIGMKENFRA